MRSLVLLAALGIPLAAPHAQSGGSSQPPAPIYFDFQVEVQASLIPGTANPKYPEVHKAAKVQGEVLAQFVIDTTGMVDTSSFKILKESDPLFARAVRNALAEMRFTPALVGNRKVKQLVQVPFKFDIQ
jgi:protein TonB